MRIRNATIDDKDFIKELDKENMSSIIEFHGEKYKSYMFDSFKPKNCFIIEDDKLIGFVYFGIMGNKLDIWSIQIKKSLWGKGFGKKLMKYILDFAVKKKLKKVVLEVNKNNNKAIRFYERLGFEKINSKKINKIAFEYIIKIN